MILIEKILITFANFVQPIAQNSRKRYTFNCIIFGNRLHKLNSYLSTRFGNNLGGIAK